MLTGCMVTNQQEQLRERFPHVDLFFDPSDFEQLEHVAPEVSDLSDDLAQLPHYYADPGASASTVSAFVPIIYGCNFLCSYCIVPYRRGKERSRPIAEIVAEVERLVAGGVREVTLLGQTVNAYGHDLPENPGLADLLRAVDAIPGLNRLRFLTSHPKYMSDEIIDAMAELPSVCEHMNLPVQAGDNEVLRRMRRTYTRDYWLDRIQLTRERMPKRQSPPTSSSAFPAKPRRSSCRLTICWNRLGATRSTSQCTRPGPGHSPLAGRTTSRTRKSSGGTVSSKSSRSVFRPRSMPRDSEKRMKCLSKDGPKGAGQGARAATPCCTSTTTANSTGSS